MIQAASLVNPEKLLRQLLPWIHRTLLDKNGTMLQFPFFGYYYTRKIVDLTRLKGALHSSETETTWLLHMAGQACRYAGPAMLPYKYEMSSLYGKPIVMISAGRS
jgi:hypothetical protein